MLTQLNPSLANLWLYQKMPGSMESAQKTSELNDRDFREALSASATCLSGHYFVRLAMMKGLQVTHLKDILSHERVGPISPEFFLQCLRRQAMDPDGKKVGVFYLEILRDILPFIEGKFTPLQFISPFLLWLETGLDDKPSRDLVWQILCSGVKLRLYPINSTTLQLALEYPDFRLFNLFLYYVKKANQLEKLPVFVFPEHWIPLLSEYQLNLWQKQYGVTFVPPEEI